MSKLGVNSRMVAGLKRLPSPSWGPTGVAASQELSVKDHKDTKGFVHPKPRGVKEGALAACDEKVGFLLPIPAGVNDGESTLSAFLDLDVASSAILRSECWVSEARPKYNERSWMKERIWTE